MKYKELLMRFMVGEVLGTYKLAELLRAKYIKEKNERVGLDRWISPPQHHYEITKQGLKKLGGEDENHT